MISTISTDVGTEYTNLNTYAANANTMASYVYGASNGHASGSSNYSTLSTGVTGATANFNSIYNTLKDMNINTDSMTDYKDIMKFVTYGIGCGILGKLFKLIFSSYNMVLDISNFHSQAP